MFDRFAEDDGAGGINGSKRRIVWDRHELRGKAIAIANGLDDRAVELVKFAVNGSAKMGGHAPMDADCITNLVGMEGEDLLFHIEIGDVSDFVLSSQCVPSFVGHHRVCHWNKSALIIIKTPPGMNCLLFLAHEK